MHNTSLKKIGQTLILIMLSLVSIFFLPSTLFSLEPLKIFIITSIGLVSLLIVVVQKIKENSFFLTRNLFILSLLGVFGASVLSAFFSDNAIISLFGRQITLYSLVGIFSLSALAFSVYTLFDDIKSKTNMFATLFISGVAVLVLHVCAIMLPFFPSLGFFFANNVTTLGTLMDLGLFALFIVLSSILVLQYLNKNTLYKISGWIGLVFGMALLAIINSGLIFMLAVLFTLVYIVVQVISDSGESKTVSYHALGIFVLSVLFLLMGGKIGLILNSYFNVQIEDVRPSLMATIEVTQDVIINEPVLNKMFGVGINRFETAWLQYRPDVVNQSQFWDTDFRYGYSYVTTIGVTQGIFGLIVWLSMILFAFYFIYKTISTIQRNDQKSFLSIYLTLSFAYFLVVLIVYNPSFVIFTLFFVFLALFVSLLKNLNLIQYKEFVMTKSPRISFAYIIKLVLCVIVTVYALYIQTTQYVSRVIFDNATISFAQSQNIDSAIEGIVRANFIYNSDVYNRALMDLGALRLREILQDQNMTQEQASDMFEEVLNTVIVIAQNTITYDSKSYLTYLSVLEIYKSLISFGVTGTQKEALSIVDQIDLLVPNNPTSYLERARIHTLSREFDIAIGYIQDALELKPNYAAAVFLLSQIQAEQGDFEEAILSTRKLISANRFDSTLYFRLGLLYYNQSRYQDSVVLFENALRLSSNFENARYFLGLSYYQANKKSDAISVFENLTSTFPENTELQKILSNMKAGRSALDGITPLPEQRSDLPLREEELNENPDAEIVEENGQN